MHLRDARGQPTASMRGGPIATTSRLPQKRAAPSGACLSPRSGWPARSPRPPFGASGSSSVWSSVAPGSAPPPAKCQQPRPEPHLHCLRRGSGHGRLRLPSHGKPMFSEAKRTFKWALHGTSFYEPWEGRCELSFRSSKSCVTCFFSCCCILSAMVHTAYTYS